MPVPLPRNYVLGIDLQKSDFENQDMSYLRGQWRVGGWWYYYLYAMAIKVPLGTWVLLLLALSVALNCSYDVSVLGIKPVPPPAGPQTATGRPQNARDSGPLPGWHALSVNRIRSRTNEYEYLLRFTPVAMAGYSIYIYHVTPEEANRVRRALRLPGLAED